MIIYIKDFIKNNLASKNTDEDEMKEYHDEGNDNEKESEETEITDH